MRTRSSTYDPAGPLKRNIAFGRCTVRKVGTSMWLTLPIPVLTQSTGPRAHAASPAHAAAATVTQNVLISELFFISPVSFFS